MTIYDHYTSKINMVPCLYWSLSLFWGTKESRFENGSELFTEIQNENYLDIWYLSTYEFEYRPILPINFRYSVLSQHTEITLINTVWCRYKAVNLSYNSSKGHPIARPLGRGMGCLLWVQTIVYILTQPRHWCVQYHVILDHVTTALDRKGKYMSWIK